MHGAGGRGGEEGEERGYNTNTHTGIFWCSFHVFFVFFFAGTFLHLWPLALNCKELWLHHDYQLLQKVQKANSTGMFQNVQKTTSTEGFPNVQKLWSLHLHYVLIQADDRLIAHQENIYSPSHLDFHSF